MLADFAKNGHIERAFTEVEAIQLVPAMQNTLRDYQQYCKDRLHVRPSTLRSAYEGTHDLLGFPPFQERADVWSKFRRWICRSSCLAGITWSRSRSRESSRTCVLFSDFSRCVGFCGRISVWSCRKSVFPETRRFRRFGITNWSSDCSAAVDRSSAKGKRDYAILLLACRLGLRAGDIRQLKLDQLHWDDSTIEVTQSKTGMPLSLPLTTEVGEALIDYLKSGRPQMAHREVFLKVNPPFDPFADSKTCTTSSRIGVGWQGSSFGLHKSGACIRFVTL